MRLVQKTPVKEKIKVSEEIIMRNNNIYFSCFVGFSLLSIAFNLLANRCENAIYETIGYIFQTAAVVCVFVQKIID